MLSRMLAVAVSALLLLAGASRMTLAADDWHNFGLGTGDQCTSPVSIDGDIAAVEDSWTGRLYYYRFSTRRTHDTGVTATLWGSGSAMVGGNRVAYFDQGQYSGPDYACGIWVYDISTGTVIDTHIRTAERAGYGYTTGRYFDGEKIAYRDVTDGRIKLYYMADGTTVDTGIDGHQPTVSGSLVAYQVWPSEWPWWARTIGLYDITRREVKDLGLGSDPQLAGSLVVYLKQPLEGGWYGDGELCYYRTDTGAAVSTGLLGRGPFSTDGKSIAVEMHGQSIKVVDAVTGVVYDTGQYGCSSADTCWIVVSGPYLAYERWEGGTQSPVTGESIYPPTDYNGDGVIDSACVAVWISLPTIGVELLVKQVVALNLANGIENSLDGKLQAAQQALGDINAQDNAAGVAALRSFIDAVHAQSGKQLSAADAESLAATAQWVIGLIGGG